MKRRVTFLLGSGRCGSTLAQRIINACPEAIIWGEHGGFLTPIANGYFRLLNNKNIQRVVYQHPNVYTPAKIIASREAIYQSDISWMNNFTPDSVKQQFKNMVEGMFCHQLPNTITYWGFKEILYGIDKNDRSLDLLLQLFPESRNIIIIRHPIDSLISMLTAWNPHLVDRAGQDNNQEALLEINKLIALRARNWTSQNKKLLKYLADFPDNFVSIKYEDMQDKFADVIFPYLEIAPPPAIESILATKVWATKNNSRSLVSRQIINSQLDKVEHQVGEIATQLNYNIASL